MGSVKDEKVASRSEKEIAVECLERMMAKGKFEQEFVKEALSKEDKKAWEHVAKLMRKAKKVKEDLRDFALYNKMTDFLSGLINIYSEKFYSRALTDSEMDRLENLFVAYDKAKHKAATSVSSEGEISVAFYSEK